MESISKVKIAIILGVMCFFLTFGIFIQINTVKESSTTVGRTQAENELRDSVLRWKEKYENAYAKLEKKDKELESLREKVANSTGSSSTLTNKLSKYNMILGNSELKGKGVIITLKDGDPSKVKGLPTKYIVHDEDLYQVVNALKNAGAEAISINEQRITSRSAISCIGNVIKINDQKVGNPFVIKAIGSPATLYGSLTMAGGYLELIERLGVQVNVEQVEKNTIIIPKYEGVYKFEYASNLE